MSTLHFLPWVRRGLGAALTAPDPGAGETSRDSVLRMYVDVAGRRARRDLALHPPDHVSALAPTEVVRRYPAPDTVDAEVAYFPVVEFAAADLPWMFSPLAPGEYGRLRPWIVLACIPQDAVAAYLPAAGDRPAQLTVPASELPDPAESWAWGHVQSTESAEVLATDPGALGARAAARLVCPRRLESGRGYRAAVVAAWRHEGDRLVPAWDPATDDQVTLTVFDTWTFACGPDGDFESLCRRLHPVAGSQRLGLRPMDVSDPGAVEPPWPSGSRVVVDFSGALWDTGLTPSGLGEHRRPFQTALTLMLDSATQRVPMARDADDPVVGPPLHGSVSAGEETVPAAGWLRELNLAPARRAAAGLGAEVVRRNQERFMAAAWDQAGQLREANAALSATRLQVEVARTWQARAESLPDGDLVQVARHALTWVRTAGGASGRRALRSSEAPEALVSPAFVRATRPAGVVARASAGRLGPGRVLRTQATRTMLAATAARPDDALAGCLGFAAPPELPQASLAGFGEVREVPEFPGGRRVTSSEALLRGSRRLEATRARRVTAGTPPGRPDLGLPPVGDPVGDPVDVPAVADIGEALRGAVDMVETGRLRVVDRVAGVAGLLPAVGLPTAVRVGPVLDEALMGALRAVDAEFVMPGADGLPHDGVRLVAVNTAFVASFLAGANHEMQRELLWREYPADLGATVFRRFWDRLDPEAADIVPMEQWGPGDRLEALGAAEGDSTAIVIRAELVRRYPSMRVLLTDPAGTVHVPDYAAALGPDTRVFGFDVDPDEIVPPGGPDGDGWLVAIEEPQTEPRFGLDVGDGPVTLSSWDDLGWRHLADPAALHVRVAAGLAVGLSSPPGAVWGHNAAHQARATHQRPFRMLFRATDLVGRSR